MSEPPAHLVPLSPSSLLHHLPHFRAKLDVSSNYALVRAKLVSITVISLLLLSLLLLLSTPALHDVARFVSSPIRLPPDSCSVSPSDSLLPPCDSCETEKERRREGRLVRECDRSPRDRSRSPEQETDHYPSSLTGRTRSSWCFLPRLASLFSSPHEGSVNI